jgi:hypothetical protein
MLCLDLPLQDDAIRRLIELLDDPQTKVHEEAVKALSYRRRAAQAAIPKLREKSAEVRRANPASAPDVFTKALEKIDPDAAKNQP